MNAPLPTVPARISLRPVGNPLGLGLLAFGIGMLMLAAEGAGWMPVNESHELGLLLAAFVFPLEGVSALLAFAARDTLSATVLGLFTTSWLALGLDALTAAPGARSVILGVFLLGFGGAVATLCLLAAAAKPLIACLLAMSATRAILYGLFELTGTSAIQRAAGYVAAAIAGGAWYVASAFLIEEMRGSSLLPTFRRGPARSAMSGELEAHADHATGEPGVRPQL